MLYAEPSRERRISTKSRRLDLPGQVEQTGPLRRGVALFGLDAEALAACMVEAGEPAWRGRQLAEAMYRQRVTELSEITTLPKPLRAAAGCGGLGRWAGQHRPGLPVSIDGTERYLVEGWPGWLQGG